MNFIVLLYQYFKKIWHYVFQKNKAPTGQRLRSGGVRVLINVRIFSLSLFLFSFLRGGAVVGGLELGSVFCGSHAFPKIGGNQWARPLPTSGGTLIIAALSLSLSLSNIPYLSAHWFWFNNYKIINLIFYYKTPNIFLFSSSFIYLNSVFVAESKRYHPLFERIITIYFSILFLFFW